MGVVRRRRVAVHVGESIGKPLRPTRWCGSPGVFSESLSHKNGFPYVGPSRLGLKLGPSFIGSEGFSPGSTGSSTPPVRWSEYPGLVSDTLSGTPSVEGGRSHRSSTVTRTAEGGRTPSRHRDRNGDQATHWSPSRRGRDPKRPGDRVGRGVTGQGETGLGPLGRGVLESATESVPRSDRGHRDWTRGRRTSDDGPTREEGTPRLPSLVTDRLSSCYRDN